MLGLPPSVRIYFATDVVDMRNGIDGLRGIVEGVLKRDPFEGHLFVFVGKSRDKVKILFWDRGGFVVYLKRLERGRFQLPVVDARRKNVELEPLKGHLKTGHRGSPQNRPKGRGAGRVVHASARSACIPAFVR